MAPFENLNYYEILELSPEASPKEIRQSYLRLKSTYSKDSLATYSLIDKNEMTQLVLLLEEAYRILSHPDKRRTYDRNYGFGSEQTVQAISIPQQEPESNVISIDRVPPMEESSSGEDLLVAPATDFTTAPVETPPPPTDAEKLSSLDQSIEAERRIAERRSYDRNKWDRRETVANEISPDPTIENLEKLNQEIANETEWSGSFLRKVRETKQISIDEILEYTKLSKAYFNAIEEDNFSKIPAPVYLRGFVMQIAKKLCLPADKVVNAYLERYRNARPEKFQK